MIWNMPYGVLIVILTLSSNFLTGTKFMSFISSTFGTCSTESSVAVSGCNPTQPLLDKARFVITIICELYNNGGRAPHVTHKSCANYHAWCHVPPTFQISRMRCWDDIRYFAAFNFSIKFYFLPGNRLKIGVSSHAGSDIIAWDMWRRNKR